MPIIESDLGRLYADLVFPDDDADGVYPYLFLNMVSTLDGKAIVEGVASKIGSDFDHQLMNRIRRVADCVLVGANTLRAEGFDLKLSKSDQEWRAERRMRPEPFAAIVTNSGDLPLTRGVFRGQGPEPLILTSQAGIAANARRFEKLEKVAKIVVAGEDRPDPRRYLKILREELGARRMLCEGGPSLNDELFRGGFVRELFLTLVPKVVGGQSKTIVHSDESPKLDLGKLSLISLTQNEAQSELYLRYRLDR